MSYMFLDSSSFNRNLSPWDVSSATSMDSMFNGASSFDQALCWDVAPDGATSTTDMFAGSLGHVDASCPAVPLQQIGACGVFAAAFSMRAEASVSSISCW